MARTAARTPLNVFLNARLVGQLRRASSGAVDFRYASEWLAWRSAFPVSYSLPLREDRYIGDPVSNVFENLLPDSETLRTRIAERVGAGGVDAFNMLSSLGRDCVGALQFLPEGDDPGAAGAVEGEPIGDAEVARILKNLASAPLGVGEDDDFRISIAGAQEKTALLQVRGEWYKPLGTTATTHILKPQIGVLPNGVDLSNSVENEHLCLKLMAAFGLPAAETEIADFEGRRTLVVERFDRRWLRDDRLIRLPQEDFCQALSVPPTRKYQTEGGPGARDIVSLLMKGSDAPDRDAARFLRAMVAFWLLGATDGHAKNFSIFLAPGGRFRLTPLYDVLTAQPSVDEGRLSKNQFKLAMSIGDSRKYRVEEIAPRHFLQTAAEAGVGQTVIREVMSDLAGTAENATATVIERLPPGFPGELTDSVFNAVRRRANILALAA